MKILCKIRAFSKGRIIKPGTILDMDECPSWGKVIDNGDKCETVVEQKETTIVADDSTAENNKLVPDADNATDVNENQDEDVEKTPEELEQKLDELLTKGLDLGIMIDGLEKLTIKEQIEKLETEINKKSEGAQ